MVDVYLIVLSFVFGPISLISSTLMIVIHLKIKKLREKWNSLIIMITVGQLIYDFQWILAYPSVIDIFTAGGCRFINTLLFYSTSIVSIYSLALTLLIYSSIHNLRIPSNRVTIWHLFANIVSILFVIVLNSVDYSNDSYRDIVCYIPKKPTKLFLCFFTLLLLLLSLGLSLYIAWSEHYEKMKYHLRITFIYSFCFIPFLLCLILHDLRALTSKITLLITAMLASLSGFLVFMCRIYDKSLIKMIKENFWKNGELKKSMEFSEIYTFDSRSHASRDVDSGYHQLFNAIYSEVIHIQKIRSLLSSLSYAFRIESRDSSFITWEGWSEETGEIIVKIEEYYAPEFEELRMIDGIERETVARSLSIEANSHRLTDGALNPGGNGAGFIFFTSDQLFIIKSINKSELQAFVSIFPDYYNKIKSAGICMMCRIYGVFKVEIQGLSIVCVIFENVLSSTQNPKMFDLKGSFANRRVLNENISNVEDIPSGVVLKDVDFSSSISYISLQRDQKSRILSSLMNDIKMLEYREIMDYSLLLAIQDMSTDLKNQSGAKYRATGYIQGKEYYIYLAIIDYFQVFNLKKKAELSLKSLKHSFVEISSIPASPYMYRFMHNLNRIFLGLNTTFQSHSNL